MAFETRLTQQEVSAVRTSEGAWNISAVVGGYRHHKTYYGYSKRDAIREFIREIKQPVRDNPSVRNLPRGYAELDKYLGNKDHRTLANNTTVFRTEDDGIAVRLHGTVIAEFWRNGRVRLNSGGWETVTTKSRINNVLPMGWRVWSDKSKWYIYRYGEQFEGFHDGMEFYLGEEHHRTLNPPQRGTPQKPSPDDMYPHPGKFEGETMLAQEMYESAMESGADAEDGDSEGPGYYWLFMDFTASDGTPRHGILSEDSQGFIRLDEFDTATDAEEAWDEEVQPHIDSFNEGEEE